MNKIRKKDKVLIISGKYRGKTGKVLQVFPDRQQVLVENVNMITKHTRPRKQGEKGQKVETPAPLDWSNVKLICPKCNKATRVGFRIVKDKKFRVCKKCGKGI